MIGYEEGDAATERGEQVAVAVRYAEDNPFEPQAPQA
jgi:hypothetical protein